MMPRKLLRLHRVTAHELAWRTSQMADIAAGRLTTALRAPAWRRSDLAAGLASSSALDSVRRALQAKQWHLAHVRLAEHLRAEPARFVIAPHFRARVTAAIRQRFPCATNDAHTRGERLLAGRYDVLGYRDVAFDGSDWHTDPVHSRSAPRRYWSRVPYLSAACGDHKIIWEFNRHQHWLELGRAYWLTGDSRYRDECLRQLETWLAANPPLIGINWASMLEIAFRSISWIWALNLFDQRASDDRSPWLVDLLLALDRQLTHVERHLSYYFSPNTHLLGEALALYVAGRALPLLDASPRREATGRRILLQEATRQIGADGGHCERSPHYHRYTLDFYLLALAIARITNDPVAGLFEGTCARLARVARALADECGLLPLIGDDDGGSVLPITHRRTDDVRDSLAIAAALTGHGDLCVDGPPEEVWWMLAHPRFGDRIARLERAGHRSPWSSLTLPATGYYISRNHQGDHVIIDGGAHGYLNGGHAHADALSIVFTRRNRPLLIDTGTGSYTIDPSARDRFRSSALHNTLILNGQSQSVPAGPFHWRLTADASVRRWRTHRKFDYFVGSHSAYAPLTHYRHVLMLHDEMLLVADCITAAPHGVAAGDAPVRADVHWHLHPDWTAELNGASLRLVAGTDAIEAHVAGGGGIERYFADNATGLGWCAPAYGRIVPTTALRISVTKAAPFWIVSVFDLDPDNRICGVAIEAADTSPALAHHAAAIRITRHHAIDTVVMAEPVDDACHLCWRASDLDADARMVFAREADEKLSFVGFSDAATLRSAQYPHVDRSYPTAVRTGYLDFTLEQGNRKAS